MPRGPRRHVTPVDQRGLERRLRRKLERIQRDSHGGFAGKNGIELIEDDLLHVCWQYQRIVTQYWKLDKEHEADGYLSDEVQAQFDDLTDKKTRLRGQIRGLATAVALLRHPYKRYTLAWWKYVKKVEKLNLQLAAEYPDQAPPRAMYGGVGTTSAAKAAPAPEL